MTNPPEDNKSDEDDTPRKVKKRKRKQESEPESEPEAPVKKKGRPSKKVKESPNIQVPGAGDELCPICIAPQRK